VDAARSFESNVLRLIKGVPECRALKAGEVDAIIDPASGRAILLPAAQTAVIERKTQFRSLVELATDGHWEQDEDYRFVSHSGAAIGNEPAGEEHILGKTLWELSFANAGEIDWQTHRTQLEWRAIFRDLEFVCVDRAGRQRRISISGEPVFDVDNSFKGYRGITREIPQRPQALAAAQGSAGFARATLDALATQVCVLDVSGTIIETNSAWRAFAAAYRGSGLAIGENDNYLSACALAVGDESVDGVAIAGGIRQVIAGERECFRHERLCGAPPAARWLMATVMPLHGAGAARAVVSYEDITDLKRAAHLQTLEGSVAACLAGADDTSAAVRAVIRAVCAAQGWDCGRRFRLDSAAGMLSAGECWGVSEVVVEQFLEKSAGAVFRAGAGLAGRVISSGEPVWMRSAAHGAHAPATALAHEIGLSGAFLFPVLAAGNAIGVLAFNGRRIDEPDERLLQAVRSIGHQLGQFLQRREAEESLRGSEQRFRQLTELSADWYWTQDTEFRFTEVVGDGIGGSGDMLGKTLWELASIVPSGDQWAAHKSVMAAQWSFRDVECAVTLADGEFCYYCLSGEPLYDPAGAFSGFHGTGLDITQRKRAEIALLQAASR
jgi:PAS domain S-box-containing protein